MAHLEVQANPGDPVRKVRRKKIVEKKQTPIKIPKQPQPLKARPRKAEFRHRIIVDDLGIISEDPLSYLPSDEIQFEEGVHEVEVEGGLVETVTGDYGVEDGSQRTIELQYCHLYDPNSESTDEYYVIQE